VRGPRRAAATPPNLPDATVLVASEPGERELPGRHASCMAGCLPAASGRRGCRAPAATRAWAGPAGSWSSGPADRTCLTGFPGRGLREREGGRPRRRGARRRQRPCVSTRLPSRSVPPRRGTHGQHSSTERPPHVGPRPPRGRGTFLVGPSHRVAYFFFEISGSPTFQPPFSASGFD